MQKLKVAVIFGGRSGEHEVSLVSATSVIEALNPGKYEIIEIGISQDGQWYTGKNCLSSFKKHLLENLSPASLITDPKGPGIFDKNDNFIKIDIAFPVLHGPFGEDGTIQGLFEMLQIPYVGCGVLASSTAMDKLQCKSIWESADLPVVPYIGFTRNDWKVEAEVILRNIEDNIAVPCFVKPANMGSSVGITKAKSAEDLVDAINLAALFDRRILVEKAINAREIECAILGNDDPVASPVGEVIVGGEFYDFHDKYVNNVSSTEIPANLDEETSQQLRDICLKAYKLLDCSGLSRVDSFVDRDTGEIYLNEINTMPGFTSISMYPKMMGAAGMGYEELVDTLIALGLDRFADKQRNRIVFESGSDWYQE